MNASDDSKIQCDVGAGLRCMICWLSQGIGSVQPSRKGRGSRIGSGSCKRSVHSTLHFRGKCKHLKACLAQDKHSGDLQVGSTI